MPSTRITRLGTALLFISHDLGVIENLVDRVLVFHNGRMVELFMLQCQPVDENMERFGEHVIPRVRSLQAKAA
ncbi:hypothetical protein H8B02_09030 [Bradyrhizobium sp. Pear77]|uniref:hypothetical protein n=1 Tax=Bradyrhizobium TaxID=374 RepID=UPI001E3F503C|nr:MULTISPECIES: hypothetical protein [Bradyrhizobium]MCC8953590.1 hypothetical protein [Bradyrhizobium altum]MCC8962899.1 hypothetical protein [Bradyrhizobium oropedii]